MLGGVSIGFATYVNSGFIRSYVNIGRYCSIGRNVTIGSGAHDFHAATTSPFFKNNSNPPIVKWANKTKRLRVDIGHDVWVGDNAYIMSGVNIGSGSIISAGAIVTKDVPPYSIYAGVPARNIGSRFDVDIAKRLLSSAFWELRPSKIEKLDIADLNGFIASVNLLREDKDNMFPVAYSVFKDHH